MGSRSRIRWPKVAKLALGVLGCLALFGGLPSLIRRPEPPPLESDIGLAPLAAAREPAPAVRRWAAHERRAAKAPGPPGGRDQTRRGGDRRPRPTRDKEASAYAGSPAVAAPAPAPAPVPVATADAHPAPSPPPPTSAAPRPTPAAAPQPTGPSEFGFER
jgi:hypothetical protein